MIKQEENEDLIDYLSRLEIEKSVLLGIICTQCLDGFTKTSQGHKNVKSINIATPLVLKNM